MERADKKAEQFAVGVAFGTTFITCWLDVPSGSNVVVVTVGNLCPNFLVKSLCLICKIHFQIEMSSGQVGR